jgi:hypothetical protein
VPDYAHFNLDEGQKFFLEGIGPRPIRGTLMHVYARTSYYGGKALNEHIAECDTLELAEKLLNQSPSARYATLNSINAAFNLIECPWALVGPRKLTIMVPSVFAKGSPLSDMKSWVKNNCTGDVCILSGSRQRRISFASEEDYLLGLMTFA